MSFSCLLASFYCHPLPEPNRKIAGQKSKKFVGSQWMCQFLPLVLTNVLKGFDVSLWWFLTTLLGLCCEWWVNANFYYYLKAFLIIFCLPGSYFLKDTWSFGMFPESHNINLKHLCFKHNFVHLHPTTKFSLSFLRTVNLITCLWLINFILTNLCKC